MGAGAPFLFLFFLLMKYGWTINQKVAIESGLNLDIIDLSIFEVLASFAASPESKKFLDNDKTYYWFKWSWLVNQAPILGLKTRQSVTTRYNKLINSKIIEPHPANQITGQAFYCFAQNYNLLCFDVPVSTYIHPVTKTLHHVTENLQIPVTNQVHPLTTDSYTDKLIIDKLINKECSDLKKSPPTKEKKKGFDIEQVTNPEHLQISSTLFDKIKQFLSARIERKASGDKITDGVWGLMIGQLAKAANEFKEDALLLHMDNGIINNWKSPFFNGYQDAIKRIKIERPPEPPKPIPRIENEEPVPNPAHEEWYCKNKAVLEGVNKDFYINRAQWMQLITAHRQFVVPRKFDIAILKAANESNPHNLYFNMDKELGYLSSPELAENAYILNQRKNAQNNG